jgi:transposase-like protein
LELYVPLLLVFIVVGYNKIIVVGYNKMSQPSIEEGHTNAAKRARYSYAEKAVVLNQLKEAGANMATVARATKIKYSTVKSWKKDEEKIWKAVDAGAKHAKSKQKDPLPSLTKMLLAWAKEVIEAPNMALNIMTIQMKAIKYKEAILKSNSAALDDKERNALLGKEICHKKGQAEVYHSSR